MESRIGIALVICLGMATASAAQVVRFQTTVGDFDMVLNPTNNPVLQAHVDNMVAYVENGNYNSSWINRAVDGFVLQMGGFYSHTKRPPLTIDSTRPFATFNPVAGEPAMENPGLSNTVGTVSLALSSLSNGNTNQNSGTSSFFVNLTSNTGLDADFTVFAAIPDMTVVNQIMALTTDDLTDPQRQPLFGADPNNLGFTDVPIMGNGFQVFIKRAFVVTDAMAVAQAKADVAPTMAASAAAFDGADGGSALAPLSSGAVPEPGTALLALIGLLGGAAFMRCPRADGFAKR